MKSSIEPQVYRGYIQYPNYKVEVAIKTCKRSNGYDDIEREARVFMKLKERNMNIVNLLGLRNSKYCIVNNEFLIFSGICIPNESELNPMILLELCEVRKRVTPFFIMLENKCKKFSYCRIHCDKLYREIWRVFYIRTVIDSRMISSLEN